MKDTYVLGIDGGSQSTKVSIFDAQGQILASASQALQPLNHFKDGRAEHPDDDLWDSLVIACQRTLKQFLEGAPERRVEQIRGIGLCTIRCCRAVLDENGRLLSPVMSWMDVRLNEPFRDPNQRIKYVTTSSGYITHRLTGAFKDTAANHEGPWPIDKTTWNWSESSDAIAAQGLRREQLFDLVAPGEILGELSSDAAQALGLSVGTPVVATANDKAVEALGAGLNTNDLSQSVGLVSLGTYIGGMRVGNFHDSVSDHYFCNMASQPNGYLYESGGIRYGMSMVSWFRDMLNERRDPASLFTDQQLNVASSSIGIGCDGLIVIPEFLAAPNKPFQRGCIIGLSASHTSAHVFKAILESIAMTMFNRMNAMNLELKQPLKELIVTGGGSHSDLLMQIFANTFGLRVTRLKHSDAAGLGAAICASVAIGMHASFAAAQAQMIETTQHFQPQTQQTADYSRLNEVFRQASEHTDELLKQLHALKIES